MRDCRGVRFEFKRISIFYGCAMTKLERNFQAKLIKDVKDMFPGCIVMKNDPNYIQGIPDLTVLYRDRWATLECKKSKDAPARPNQPHYVDRMREMSYSAFIFPENRDEVLGELSKHFHFDEKDEPEAVD